MTGLCLYTPPLRLVPDKLHPSHDVKSSKSWINSSQSTKSYWKRGLEVLPYQTDKKFFTYGNWETNVTCFKIISSLRLFHPIDLLSKQ